MDLRNVTVKKVQWSPRKLDADGFEKDPPKLTVQLEIAGPQADLARELIEFAQGGPTDWRIEEAQRVLGFHGVENG